MNTTTLDTTNIEETVTKAPVPAPSGKTIWSNNFSKNYPRPQGNLPMFSWGLTNNAQQHLKSLFPK